MHFRCGISCASSISRQPGALLLPARSHATFRPCHLAGHSRQQSHTLYSRWQIKAAVSLPCLSLPLTCKQHRLWIDELNHQQGLFVLIEMYFCHCSARTH
jgi:hypothetical protein